MQFFFLLLIKTQKQIGKSHFTLKSKDFMKKNTHCGFSRHSE